jgi:predicted nucleotidyltransferase
MTNFRKQAIKVDFNKLSDFFIRDNNVACAIVFGSSQNGSIAPGSDLDIGILFQNPPKNSIEEFDYYQKLCDHTDFADVVDMVVMNNANEILAFEILNGRYVDKKDPEKSAEFFSYTCRVYEDTMYTQNKARTLYDD